MPVLGNNKENCQGCRMLLDFYVDDPRAGTPVSAAKAPAMVTSVDFHDGIIEIVVKCNACETDNVFKVSVDCSVK